MILLRYFLIILQTTVLLSVYAQTNLIPDSEFDQFDYKGDWFYSHRQFNDLSKSWKTPIPTSPDIYGPGIDIPKDWLRNGFGDNNLHKNNHIAGITVYGCDIGKPHCREYLMIELDEPIKDDCPYVIDMLLSPLKNARQIMYLDLSFVDSALYFNDQEESHFESSYSIALPKMKSGKWTSISDTIYDLRGDTRYMIIGNFKSDEQTLYRRKVGKVELGYYYIDKVKLWQLCKSAVIIDSTNYENWLPLSIGKRIVLEDVYFDFDDDQLKEESKMELFKLLRLMEDHPHMQIRIKGYTDSDGTKDYNLELSRRRAHAVSNFLLSNGIMKDRVTSSGYGESKPIESNNTKLGRAKNRRVEFEITNL